MFKTVLVAAALTVGLTGASFAASPKSEAECQALLKSSFTTLSAKKLSADAAKKAEEMLDKLGEQCEAKKYDAAAATAKALEGLAG